MDLYEAVRSRSSIRSYQAQAIEPDKLRRVLEAARLAPSARNAQQWKFVIVQDAAIRQALAAAAEQEFLAQAAAIVAAVSLDPQRVMHCGVASGPVDCAIAMEHIALAATAEGLGTCWIGHFDQDRCRGILHVPDTAMIIELMTMGYPAAAGAPKRRKPLDEIVCHNRFA